MFQIPVVVGSVRRGRQSPKVAPFLVDKLRATGKVEPQPIDLLELALPIMEERVRKRDDPPPGAVTLASAFQAAHAIVFVTPEYNHGIPGVVKNAIDYLGPSELKRKPVGIVTVSAGGFGGIFCLQQMRQCTMALGAIPVPASLPVSKVESFTPDDAFAKRTQAFIDELLWLTEAIATKR
jgi:NAD(P)H-dependent FMN reductase